MAISKGLNLRMKFSIIIPTRHRPEFVRKSLEILKLQTYQDFEVIVSDNYINESLSAKRAFDEVNLTQSIYVRPSSPVGMVENWNYPLQFATGDYVCYLTDKMFILPHTLEQTNELLESKPYEIVSWLDDSYVPKSYTDYFGPGTYIKAESNRSEGPFDPLVELSVKGNSLISRREQSKDSYAIGKLLFGCYSMDLVNRIKHKYQKPFSK